MKRIANTMSLIISLIGIYKELSKEVKILISLNINICKENTELLQNKVILLIKCNYFSILLKIR